MIQIPIVKPPSLSSLLLDDDLLEKRKRRQVGQDDLSNLASDGPEAANGSLASADDIGEPGYEPTTLSSIDGQEEPLTTTSADLVEENSEDELSRAEYYSLELYPDPYCDMVLKMPRACLEWSILELWAYDGRYDERTDLEIDNLNLEQVLDKINNYNLSGVFLQKKNFTEYLADVSYDQDGNIVGAKATLVQWFGKMNGTEALLNPVADRDEPIDRRTLQIEGDLLEVLLNQTGYPDGLRSFPNAQRSFGDIAFSTIYDDVTFSAASFAILMVYILAAIGKFSVVESRSNLATAGLISVAMGIIVAYGFCSGIGLVFGPMHNVLPFLLLGIGIDDMFVIVQSWDNLFPGGSRGEEGQLQFGEKFGKTLAHAGVAITITSVTDVVAFAVGGSTILPALRSFCFFAAVGIFAVFVFQSTFFVAVMSIDRRRVESNRNVLLPCYKHKKTPKAVCNKSSNFSEEIFKLYGRFLTKLPVKVFVVLLTAATTAVGIWGFIQLEQKFVPSWFLPPESYLAQWINFNEKYFPSKGARVTVWCHDLDYVQDLEQLHKMSEKLSAQDDIIDDVDAWFDKFLDYASLQSSAVDPWSGNFSDFQTGKYFNHKLTQFLFSPAGARYRDKFRFETELQCGFSSPKIELTDFSFSHKNFNDSGQQISAMNRVKKIISDFNFTGNVFPLSQGSSFCTHSKLKLLSKVMKPIS